VPESRSSRRRAQSARAELADPNQLPLAAVLAGGAGRRIGGAKPATRLGGRPLISYPVAAAVAAGLEVRVVAKRDSVLPPLDCAVIFEPDLPRHPLCGILAALEHAEGRPILALACDMPFLEPALLLWLAARRGSAVVVADGRLQPLLARYAASDLAALEDALEQRLSATAAVELIGADRLAVARFGDPRWLCFNVNDAADIELAEHRLAETHQS
jgi:molybdenum cofactor guanylyltransferase